MKQEYGNGSASLSVYIVEARTSYIQPTRHSGMILDNEWRRVDFPTAPIGVRNLLLHGDAVQHGFLNYEAAMALAHWFMAEPSEESVFPFPAVCVETRIVEVRYKYTYSTEEVGVGPTMSMMSTLRATKFQPRETKPAAASEER